MLVALVVVVWVAVAWLSRWVMVNPRDDVDAGLVLLGMRVYCRLVHRVRYSGLGHLAAVETRRPLIVVSNHTAGVDPLLIQNATRLLEPRWMMAADMRIPVLEPFWNWAGIIDVARYSADPKSARVALSHLKAGGVLGIFPEGGIERPPRSILPFLPGVGLLIRRSGATVLPVIIEGTPQVDPAFAALWHPSRSTVRFEEPIDYADAGMSAAQIVADLQARYEAWTGWPTNAARADGVGGDAER